MKTQHTPGPWRYVDGCVYAGEEHGGLRALIAIPTTPRNPDLPPVDTFSPEWDSLRETESHNARVIAAAPELLSAWGMGASKNTPDFLDWIADRLVRQYGESPNVDFVLSLRERAAAGRAAVAKTKESL